MRLRRPGSAEFRPRPFLVELPLRAPSVAGRCDRSFADSMMEDRSFWLMDCARAPALRSGGRLTGGRLMLLAGLLSAVGVTPAAGQSGGGFTSGLDAQTVFSGGAVQPAYDDPADGPPPFPTGEAVPGGGSPSFLGSGSATGVEPAPARSAELPGMRGGWGSPASTGPSPTGTSLLDRSSPAGGVLPASGTASPQRASVADILGQPIAEVRISGNRSIPTWAIERIITETRVGRTVNAEQIRKDKAALVSTRWFLSVREQVLVTEEGPVVVFDVIEAPKLERVEFVGNKKFSSERLSRETGLVPGHGFDVAANLESVQRIRELYREKGYVHADVRLERGGDPNDREVRIVIDEGPKVVVSWISFEGNRFVSGPVLKTVLSTKTQWLLLFGGKYNADSIRNDVQALKAYYEGLGFFDVEVEAQEQTSRDGSRVHVTFHIQEGMRYRVRNIEVKGNQALPREELLSRLKLKPGDAFNTRFLQADAQAMKEKYDGLGRPFAAIQPVPRFLEEPGWLDLVYDIDEDKVCYVGRINIRIRGDSTHTSTAAVRHRINRYLQPGQLARSKDIQAARTVIATDPIFDREDPPSFNIRRVSGEDYGTPSLFARAQDDDLSPHALTHLRPVSPVPPLGFNPRGDGPLWRAPGVSGWFDRDPVRDWESPPTAAPPPSAEHAEQPSPERPSEDPLSYLEPTRRPRRSDREPPSFAPAGGETPQADAPLTPPQLVFSDGVLLPEEAEAFPLEEIVWRGQSLDSRGLPRPQNYLFQDSNQGDPFGDALRAPAPDFVDIDIDVTEGRTGRLSFGAGINSNAGVVGNIVLQEDNFDILRFPRNWGDVLHGRAFRGGGQSFRMEAIPGTQVSRYTISWRTPYFLGTDFSFGVDGFYYNRFFENWTEDRTGGRISLGYIINRHWTAGAALRLESVRFRDFLRSPFTPQLYLDVAGRNFLSTAQFRLAHDTRDSPFLPSQGHFLEFAYEQAFGEFTYPRFDLTGSQYFTLYERADGRGKHILQLRGETVWTGSGTPVFERLYAGGFQSFRGFAFRGVAPRENSYRIGGRFLLLGTAEYQFPITAGDAVRGVLFTDCGTVDTVTTLDKFRVTAGFGFRFTIPAMGPAPLAFDFAWPILSEREDTEQIFSFYIGTTF